ncbi:MAG: alkaline phosphatase family protein [Phycisphaerales bacterium]
MRPRLPILLLAVSGLAAAAWQAPQALEMRAPGTGAATAATNAPAAPTSAAAPSSPFRHVILVSVDGLRPDAIDGPEDGALPAFARLRQGPGTLQARADPDFTITLPNHVGMLTGRPVMGPQGHAWRENDDPRAARDGGTIHKHRGFYVASAFDVAHDHGRFTAVVAAKEKFVLLQQSYDSDAGAPDQTGTDHGRAKIDAYAWSRDPQLKARTVLEFLRSARDGSFIFLHLGEPDYAGHAEGWDLRAGSAYRAAVTASDAALGTLLAGIDADPALRGQVAIVLTADHGGGDPFRNHGVARARENFLVPLLVWLGRDTAPQELIALNADHRAVVSAETWLPLEASPPPVRSAETGNLALQLLGLPPIPGSVANARQDLRLQEPAR